MTAIGSAPRVDIGRLKTFDPASAIKAADHEIARFQEVWKDRVSIPGAPAANDASNVYATVKVNGKAVATIFNSGATMTSNADFGRISTLPSMGEGETSTGPELARKRADEIARALGGTIDIAPPRQTLAQFQREPAGQWTADAAMAAAMAARNAHLESTKVYVQAQIIAQSVGA